MTPMGNVKKSMTTRALGRDVPARRLRTCNFHVYSTRIPLHSMTPRDDDAEILRAHASADTAQRSLELAIGA